MLVLDPDNASMPVDLSWLYDKYELLVEAQKNKVGEAERRRREVEDLPALDSFLLSAPDACDGEGAAGSDAVKSDGFARMEKCLLALDALDQTGWKRSYHQRKFHHAFLGASARAFFKLDGPGAFQRAHHRVMEINQFENLNQEILISTPRRFGKTISVSMFSAALLFSCSGVELSVYSTCKRISQKLLRNIVKECSPLPRPGSACLGPADAQPPPLPVS